jgi:hypothetical protein
VNSLAQPFPIAIVMTSTIATCTTALQDASPATALLSANEHPRAHMRHAIAQTAAGLPMCSTFAPKENGLPQSVHPASKPAYLVLLVASAPCQGQPISSCVLQAVSLTFPVQLGAALALEVPIPPLLVRQVAVAALPARTASRVLRRSAVVP